jgi:hypothetical protein
VPEVRCMSCASPDEVAGARHRRAANALQQQADLVHPDQQVAAEEPLDGLLPVCFDLSAASGGTLAQPTALPAIGSAKLNVEPLPTCDSAEIRPP